MVTPPADVHSHHNDGDETMTCLIVQDGGLHTHCRTMDFRYAD
jgi:gentisate 1,2-dioxygenase